MSTPLFLLLLLYSCRSSSIPIESASTREKQEEEIDKARQAAPDNDKVAMIHNPRSKKIEETQLQKTRVQTNHPSDARVVNVVNHVSNKENFYYVTELVDSISNATGSLEAELSEPTTQLDIADTAISEDSIALIHRYVEMSVHNPAATNNKEVITVLGETGTGKSTSINYWIGCQMALKTPEELGIEGGLDDVIVVDPDSAQPEVASIGHEIASHTLMPQIIQDLNHDTRVYCDFPGFSDNRGPEINIAHAINIRRVLQHTSTVKVVVLTNYSNFIGRRNSAVQFLENACEQLFGGVENLRKHQNAVLLGINRAPLQTRLHRMRAQCSEMGSPTMQILANRVFLYDPLERGGQDFWSKDQFLTEINQLPSIPQNVARSMFQTVLTDNNKTTLQRIVRHQVNALNNALEQNNYPAASRCWRLINQLRIIEHDEITALLEGQVKPHMRSYAAELTATFSQHAAEHNFTDATRLLVSLQSLNDHFPDEKLVDLKDLGTTLNTAREKHNAQQEADEARQRADEELQRAIEARQRADETTRVEAEARQRADETTRVEAEARQKAEEELQKAEKERQRAVEEQQRARRAREAEEARLRRMEAELEEIRKQKK